LANTETLIETLTKEQHGPNDGENSGAHDKKSNDCGEVTYGLT
jgi:hypothetical protein